MRPANISTGGAQNYYYEKDPLMNKDGQQHNTQWHGQGAGQLGLSGRIEAKDFEKVTEGQDPRTGETLVRPSLSNGEHRAGVDIPLSAPKSVSHAALVLKDERLIEAHDKAVSATIAKLESDYSYTRDQCGGQCTQILQGNLCIATFRHGLSRGNDPQMHSHVFFSNIVQTPDGPRALTGDAIFRDQTYINKIYQAELATNVKELGYGIETKASGTWEISGYRQEILDQFSKRSGQVDQAEAQMKQDRDNGKYPNATDGALNQMAARGSRAGKDKNMTAEKFDTSMQEQHEKLGVSIDQVRQEVQQAAEKGREAGKDSHELNEYEHIRLAVKQLQATESCFTKQDVLSQAIKNSYGQHTDKDLSSGYKEMQQGKGAEIVKVGEVTNSRGLTQEIHSTPQMVKIEKYNIKNIEAGKGKSNVAFERKDVEKFILAKEAAISKETGKDFKYTADQKRAAEEMLCSKDNTVLVQGGGGVGKTTVMDLVRDYAASKGVEVKGFAFTGKAVYEMQAAGLKNSQTVSSFLQQTGGHYQPAGKEMWIVDECSMIGSKDGAKMLKMSAEAGIKRGVVGDVSQKQSIAAGKFFKDIQEKTSVSKVDMQESRRFTTEEQRETTGHLKAAGDALRKGETNIGEHTDRAIASIEKVGHFHEIATREGRQAMAVDLYFDAADRGKTSMVLTKTNAERAEINDKIRGEREARGEIGQGKTFNIKDPANIQADKATIAASYKLGQSILVRDHIEEAGLKKGAKAEITGIDRAENTIIVQGNDGKERVIDLKGNGNYEKFSTYDNEQREFAQDDRVVFLENDTKLGVKNGMTGEIKSVDERGNVTVGMDGGKKEVSFNLNEGHKAEAGDAKYSYNKIDHAYAVTVEKAEGATSDISVQVTESKSPGLNFNDANTAATRGREEHHVITDSKEGFADKISDAQEKTSTLDHEKSHEQEHDKSMETAKEEHSTAKGHESEKSEHEHGGHDKSSGEHDTSKGTEHEQEQEQQHDVELSL